MTSHKGNKGGGSEETPRKQDDESVEDNNDLKVTLPLAEGNESNNLVTLRTAPLTPDEKSGQKAVKTEDSSPTLNEGIGTRRRRRAATMTTKASGNGEGGSSEDNPKVEAEKPQEKGDTVGEMDTDLIIRLKKKRKGLAITFIGAREAAPHVAAFAKS